MYHPNTYYHYNQWMNNNLQLSDKILKDIRMYYEFSKNQFARPVTNMAKFKHSLIDNKLPLYQLNTTDEEKYFFEVYKTLVIHLNMAIGELDYNFKFNYSYRLKSIRDTAAYLEMLITSCDKFQTNNNKEECLFVKNYLAMFLEYAKFRESTLYNIFCVERLPRNLEWRMQASIMQVKHAMYKLDAIKHQLNDLSSNEFVNGIWSVVPDQQQVFRQKLETDIAHQTEDEFKFKSEYNDTCLLTACHRLKACLYTENGFSASRYAELISAIIYVQEFRLKNETEWAKFQGRESKKTVQKFKDNDAQFKFEFDQDIAFLEKKQATNDAEVARLVEEQEASDKEKARALKKKEQDASDEACARALRKKEREERDEAYALALKKKEQEAIDEAKAHALKKKEQEASDEKFTCALKKKEQYASDEETVHRIEIEKEQEAIDEAMCTCIGKGRTSVGGKEMVGQASAAKK